MCGIVGIISSKEVSNRIVNSLKKLEYRGYDSAGIATLVNGNINEEFEKIQNELISEKEFTKVRNMLENNFLGNFRSMIGIAENLANYEMYFGDANLINTELDRYMKVTREDIQRVAKKYFNTDNRVVLYYLPKENG